MHCAWTWGQVCRGRLEGFVDGVVPLNSSLIAVILKPVTLWHWSLREDSPLAESYVSTLNNRVSQISGTESGGTPTLYKAVPSGLIVETWMLALLPSWNGNPAGRESCGRQSVPFPISLTVKLMGRYWSWWRLVLSPDWWKGMWMGDGSRY